MFRELRSRHTSTLPLSSRPRLIVVSNREPFVHEHQGGRVVCTQPAGGLTAALNPLLKRLGGTWIALGSGAADAGMVDRNSRISVPPDRPGYVLRRVWINDKLRREYYSGLANRGIWPLCHHVDQRPRFAASEWQSYRTVNEIFASAVLEEVAGEAATVFIQDYHLALLPQLLRKGNTKLAIAHFWHIPWPEIARFSLFPWKSELLNGMLGSDVLGFHLAEHCANFLECVDRTNVAQVDFACRHVFNGHNSTSVSDFPIGIDFESHIRTAAGVETQAAVDAWRGRVEPGVRIGIGIDRMDYTKGIPQRIRALDLFLERHPEWREKLVFLQVGVPSRTDIPDYCLLAREIRQEIDRVNARWRAGRWLPIQFIEDNLPAEQMIALHRIADFCLVTPLHDGMNLVAKEFVASRSDLDGVLVLSCFAGASVELTSAVLVNPFSEDEIAGGIWKALNLPYAERRARMSRLRAAVQSNDVYHWAANILSAVAAQTGKSVVKTQALGTGQAKVHMGVAFS